MGRRGPRPTPTAALRLVGSREVPKRRHEPKPEIAAPTAPTWLGREAKAEWGRIVPQLVALGVISRLDRAVVTMYCQTWGEYCELSATIRKSGTTSTTPNGYEQQSPEVGMRNAARMAWLRFAQELGLSPSARTKISGMPKRGSDDPLGKFRASAKGTPDRAG